MSLVPGSYACAAGLQSEISKVTITRVANSEVQYRRTIDTYQRDLRFSVNQIRREQQQLRASMRHYRHRLREGRQQRRERQAREREREDHWQQRKRTVATDLRQGQRGADTDVLTLADNATSAPVLVMVNGLSVDNEGLSLLDARVPVVLVQSEAGSHSFVENTLTLPFLADSPDSGRGDNSVLNGESGDSTRGKTLTLSKTKAAYFRAKRGGKDKAEEEQTRQRLHRHGHQHQRDEVAESGGNLNERNADSFANEGWELRLPAISEDRSGPGNNDTLISPGTDNGPSLGQSQTPWPRSSKPGADDSGSDGRERKRTLPGARAAKSPVHATNMLHTKSFGLSDNSASSKLAERAPTEGDRNEAGIDDSDRPAADLRRSETELQRAAEEAMKQKGLQEVDMMLAEKLSQRKPRRRAAISYGDLVKVRHGNSKSTKRLFSLVDRLASKHGIVDPPPVTSSTLDPRANAKIRQRGDESQASSSMVRQAAVLYYMKYGNRPNDPPVHDGLQFREPSAGPDRPAQSWNPYGGARLPAGGLVGEEEGEELGMRGDEVVVLSGGQEVLIRRRHGTSSTTILPSQPESYRRAAAYGLDLSDNDATSLDASQVAAWPGGGSTGHLLPGLDVFRADPRGRSRGQATMLELSQQASRVRDRTWLLGVPPPPPSVHPSSSSFHPTTTASTTDTPTVSGRESRDPRGQLLSPLSKASRRAQARNPRQSVESVERQLQKRLQRRPGGEKLKAESWTSAIGRLKVLHTLHDLSQHFE